MEESKLESVEQSLNNNQRVIIDELRAAGSHIQELESQFKEAERKIGQLIQLAKNAGFSRDLITTTAGITTYQFYKWSKSIKSSKTTASDQVSQPTAVDQNHSVGASIQDSEAVGFPQEVSVTNGFTQDS